MGTLEYELGKGYTIIRYKQNGKWGLLYIQCATGSGGGIFPSAGFHVAGLGKLHRTVPKHDKLLNQIRGSSWVGSYDGFITVSNGKFGLLNPVTGEEHLPQFDTIPKAGWPERTFEVRKMESGV